MNIYCSELFVNGERIDHLKEIRVKKGETLLVCEVRGSYEVEGPLHLRRSRKGDEFRMRRFESIGHPCVGAEN